MGFHEMFRLQTSVPSLLPSMTYHEHSVGVPVLLRRPGRAGAARGPYFFMPIVLLDHVLATIGGLLFWGYAKRLATIRDADGRYSATAMSGEPVVSVSYEYTGEAKPIADVSATSSCSGRRCRKRSSRRSRSAWDRSSCSRVFRKRWEVATIRPLRAVTEIFTDYVVGLSSGRYPATDRSADINESVMGSYELSAPWQLGSPYPSAVRWTLVTDRAQ